MPYCFVTGSLKSPIFGVKYVKTTKQINITIKIIEDILLLKLNLLIISLYAMYSPIIVVRKNEDISIIAKFFPNTPVYV